MHTAIDQADLIIAIGHDTVEKPPFIMGPGGPTVIHVVIRRPMWRRFTPRRRWWSVMSGRVCRCWLIGWRSSCRCVGVVADAAGILARIAAGADEGRFPPTPQRIVADVRAVMPDDGIVALDNGMYKIWFARNYRAPISNTLLLDNALATMGAGLPSAMMAAIIYPQRRVLGGVWRWWFHDEFPRDGDCCSAETESGCVDLAR